MNSSIAELNALLFENTDKIPEGLYLQLMNLSAKVYKEQTKTEVKTVITETPILKLDNITTWKSANTIRLGTNNNINITGNILKLGGIIQVLQEGNSKQFYRLYKINDYSVRFQVWTAIYDIMFDKYVWYFHYVLVKTKNIKNIMVYNRPEVDTRHIFNATIDKTNLEHIRHNTGANVPSHMTTNFY